MKIRQMALCAALGCTLSLNAEASQQVLNIYNWADYIAPEVIKGFEKDTGIRVNYDVYDSNETLDAKLMAGRSGYDLVFPSSSYMQRQIKAGVYASIDKAKLSHYANLDPRLLEKVSQYDPNNAHSVPYTWGTTGIAYNKKLVEARLGKDFKLDTWALLFDPKVAKKLSDCGIALLDSPTEVFALTKQYLGLDPNSESKADLNKAVAQLRSVQPYIRYFDSAKPKDDLATGEICVAMGYNGDALQLEAAAVAAGRDINIAYTIPREGTSIWFDMMAMPKDGLHREAALKFINYVLRKDSAAAISNFVYYAVPNTAAEPLLSQEVRTNPAIHLSAAQMSKLFVPKAQSAKYERLMTRAWLRVKTGR